MERRDAEEGAKRHDHMQMECGMKRMEKKEILLSAEQITKTYGGRTIIEEISLTLNRGELVSLLGVSGSGKTTLFHILSGLTEPDEGKVFLHGEEITGRPGKISYMMQKDLLLPHKKIIDNVSLPLVINGMGKKEARKKADPLFPEFGLEGTQYRYPSQLSGGMRQRAALLRTYLPAASRCWMSRSAPWILSPNRRFINGIWILWNVLICPPYLLPMILMKRFYCLTGSISWGERRERSGMRL